MLMLRISWWESLPRAAVYTSTTLVILYAIASCLIFIAPKQATHISSSSLLADSSSSELSSSLSSRAETTLHNLAFGIAAGSEVWDFRKNYVETWWQPGETRGFVWMEKLPAPGNLKNLTENQTERSTLPGIMISANTSRFRYTFAGWVNINEQKHQVRMARIISEMFRLQLPEVDWFVIGDDDTVFFPHNLVKVLSKYDHRKFYYIGCISESHLQNVQGFSTNMAYGGAGYAISYPLAKELEKMEDDCLQRYHFLYSSDARIHACLAELGVTLTIEPGFHQFDIHGDASGILGAHPLAPILSLHHIDRVDPIFPGMDRVSALKHLYKAYELDPGALLQQSICYNMQHGWSVKVSWGYAVQVMRLLVAPKDLELPVRTFVGWHDDRNEIGFSFKSHAMPADPCLRYEIFYMTGVAQAGDEQQNQSFSSSSYRRPGSSSCTLDDQLAKISWINVTKASTQDAWYQAPRRQCCRIVQLKDDFMHLDVSDCKPGELSTITPASSSSS